MKMNGTKDNFERIVGDAFIQWYNQIIGLQFTYAEKPREAPDLKYSDNSNILLLEICGAYFSYEEAIFRWKNLRKNSIAPQHVAGIDMDEALIANINQRIVEKCEKSYGTGCFLVIYTQPTMTTAKEVEERLTQIKIPTMNPFHAIYLTGHFPFSSNGSIGGYQCWRLFDIKHN
jgi:hypothetical protein